MGEAEQEQKQSGKESLNRSRWWHCLFEDAHIPLSVSLEC